MTTSDIQELVESFHEAMGLPVGNFLAPEITQDELCLRLIGEELGELCEAVGRRDLPETADALGDLVYVTVSAAVRWGIDLEPVMREIQRANMAKVGGPIVEGKQQKPLGWVPPDIAGVLARQVAR